MANNHSVSQTLSLVSKNKVTLHSLMLFCNGQYVTLSNSWASRMNFWKRTHSKVKSDLITWTILVSVKSGQFPLYCTLTCFHTFIFLYLYSTSTGFCMHTTCHGPRLVHSIQCRCKPCADFTTGQWVLQERLNVYVWYSWRLRIYVIVTFLCICVVCTAIIQIDVL